MTYLTESRDALAKALHDAGSCQYEPTDICGELADALIASGAVVAADTLADDEALIEQAQQEWIIAGMRPGWAHILRALAAALSKRGQ